jgi:hypothetical protein
LLENVPLYAASFCVHIVASHEELARRWEIVIQTESGKPGFPAVKPVEEQ